MPSVSRVRRAAATRRRDRPSTHDTADGRRSRSRLASAFCVIPVSQVLLRLPTVRESTSRCASSSTASACDRRSSAMEGTDAMDTIRTRRRRSPSGWSARGPGWRHRRRGRRRRRATPARSSTTCPARRPSSAAIYQFKGSRPAVHRPGPRRADGPRGRDHGRRHRRLGEGQARARDYTEIKCDHDGVSTDCWQGSLTIGDCRAAEVIDPRRRLRHMTLTVRAADRGAGAGPRRARVRAGRCFTCPREGRARSSSSSMASAGSASPPSLEAFAAEATCSRRGRPSSRLRRRSSPPPRGFLAAISTATGGDLATAEDAAVRLGRPWRRASSSSLDRYEVLRPLDLWLQQEFVPAWRTTSGVVLAGREAPMAGWSMAMGQLFREPAAGQPAARRRRGAAPPGRRRRRRRRAHQPARARPSPVAAPRRVRARRAGPALDHEATTVTAIVEELTELYLAAARSD